MGISGLIQWCCSQGSMEAREKQRKREEEEEEEEEHGSHEKVFGCVRQRLLCLKNWHKSRVQWS